MQHNARTKSVVVGAHPVGCIAMLEGGRRKLREDLCLCSHCQQPNGSAECMVVGVQPLWLHHKTEGKQKEAEGQLYVWVSVVQHNARMQPGVSPEWKLNRGKFC